MNATGRVHAGELLISLGLLALGSFIVYETQGIAETQGYAQVGPRLFPYIVGAGLALCGAVLGWQSIFGGWRNVPLDQPGHDAPDWTAFGIVSAGIVLHMIVIGYAGFVLAGALLFALVARGFGSRRPERDAVIALVLATVVYLIFTRALGLKLPAAPFLPA
jgi:putative tricarboxylic transport membrane protein